MKREKSKKKSRIISLKILSCLVLFLFVTMWNVNAEPTEKIQEIKNVLLRSDFIKSDNFNGGEDTQLKIKECGNTRDKAKEIEVDEIIKEKIDYDGDIDVYKILLKDEQLIGIDSTEIGEGLSVLFFNSKGKILNNGGEKVNPELEYYLIVWGNVDLQGLEYSFCINKLIEDSEFKVNAELHKSNKKKEVTELNSTIKLASRAPFKPDPWNPGYGDNRTKIELKEEVFYIRVTPFDNLPNFKINIGETGYYEIDNKGDKLTLSHSNGQIIAKNLEGKKVIKLNGGNTYHIDVNGDSAIFMVKKGEAENENPVLGAKIIEYEYDESSTRLLYIKVSGERYIKFEYDQNGNLTRKIKLK